MSKGRRDVGVEAARLLACLIVIGCHTLLPYQLDGGEIDRSRLFMSMLFADGVSLFWLITGAFLFRPADYRKVLMRNVTRVLVPTLLVGWLVYLPMRPLLTGDGATLDGVQLVFSARDAASALIRWRNGIPGFGHSWYVYIHMLVIFCLPLVSQFARGLGDASEQNERTLLTVFGLALLINDLTCNELFSFQHYSINGMIPALMICMIGHIIYGRRDRLEQGSAIVPIVGFVAVNVARFLIFLMRANSGNADRAILYWYSLPGVLASSCLLIACFRAFPTQHPDEGNHHSVRWLEDVVLFLSAQSFAIYLIHQLVRDTLRSKDFFGRLEEIVQLDTSGAFGEICYQACSILVIFSISLLLVLIYIIAKAHLMRIVRGKSVPMNGIDHE